MYYYSDMHGRLQDGCTSVQIDSSSKKIGVEWEGSIGICARTVNGTSINNYLIYEKNLKKKIDDVDDESELYHISSWKDLDQSITEIEEQYNISINMVTTDHAMLFFNKLKKLDNNNNLLMTQVKNIKNGSKRVVVWCWVHRCILCLKALTSVEALRFIYDISRDLIGFITSGEINNNLLEYERGKTDIREALSEFVSTRWQYQSAAFDLLIKNRCIIVRTLKRIADSQLQSKSKAISLLKRIKWTYWWCMAICMCLFMICLYISIYILIYIIYIL